jgi:DNA (cytosine-5)-methyltransferase 1
MTQLVLSLFPGIGLLDRAFEEEGFVVVRGPDVLWGGDIRRFHPPAGKFDGVIGGPPCQAFSRLVHMVRQNGYEPKFGNLIPEFERVVSEAKPQWFLMENVPDAPRPNVAAYKLHSFAINNRQCLAEDGEPAKQNRVRAITFGWVGEHARILNIDIVALENIQFEYAATGGSQRPAQNGHVVSMNRNGKVKAKFRDGKGRMPFNSKSRSAIAELLGKQGLPLNWLEHSPFTVEATCKMLGNGVPLPMGRAIAKAICEAIGKAG